MNSRQRLMAALKGEPTDRPGVNFYEVGGFAVNPSDPDPFNIYNSPSWQPVLRLAEEQTDLIRMREMRYLPHPRNRRNEFFMSETHEEGNSRITRTTLHIAGRTLTSLSRRNWNQDTTWQTEYLLKDADDLRTWLQLPDDVFVSGDPDVGHLIQEDEALGDRGIVMVDTPDPICIAALLFGMQAFTCVSYTEQALFHRLLEKIAGYLYPSIEAASRAFPGHLWRVFGPECATEPYLPTALFREYVVRYTTPVVHLIKEHGGYVRLHCHGRIRNALPHILSMGADAIDPIEPPPLGDVDLAFVRREYGKDLTLFGNLEARDLEMLEPREFEKIVARSLRDGTSGEGRGFVLMPSACPYGRELSERVLANYQTMIRLTKGLCQPRLSIGT